MPNDKPWQRQTLAGMRAFALSQVPPILIPNECKRKADVHALLTRVLQERAAGGTSGEVSRDSVPSDAKPETPAAPLDYNALTDNEYACHRCGAPATDPNVPLCPKCQEGLGKELPETPIVLDADDGRADGRDPDAMMDAWRKGEAVDEDALSILDKLPGKEVTLARLPTHAQWNTMNEMAVRLHGSTLVKSNRAEDVVVKLLAAHDLGISSTMALQLIHVIDGKPSISGQLMIALVRHAGYSITPVVMTAERAVAKGVRGAEVVEFEFTIEEAREAGLLGKDNWLHYPKMMLWWRAVAGVGRILFPDVLGGLSYTPEELGANVDEQGEVIDAQGWESPSTPARQPEPPASSDGTVTVQQTDRLFPLCTHDGTGTCCLNIIKSRIDALPADVRAVVQEEWAERRSAGELPAFSELQHLHRPIVQQMLLDAEAQVAQLAQPVGAMTGGAVGHTESTPDLSSLGATEVSTDDIPDAEIVTEPTASDITMAARAREIAENARQNEARMAGQCVGCGEVAPLDSGGWCKKCEPF